MRPGQNKRMRGRNNNNNSGGNRRGPNPLTRSYESNGPDVKIRGTAHHIGEKYLQLARDAQSSGDPVMAESYLQHAEHYFRLIAAAQQAQQQAQFGYQRQPGEQVEQEDDGDDDFDNLPDRFASPADRSVQAPAPQPFQDRQPYEARNDRGGQHQAHGNQGYGDRNADNRPRGERPAQPDRQQGGGNPQNHSAGPREDRAPRDYDNRNFRNRRDERQPRDFRDNGQPRDQQPRDSRPSVPDEQPAVGLPAFITAPTRVPQDQPDQPRLEGSDVQMPVTADGEGGDHMRPRRRRRPKPDFAGAGAGNDAPAAGEHEGGE